MIRQSVSRGYAPICLIHVSDISVFYVPAALTCLLHPPQTSEMAQTYLLFDFGSDEQKVQQARHKLESWKQAFRLDKKLQYKFEREQTADVAESAPESESKPTKAEKPKPAKPKGKSASAKSKAPESEAAAENQGDVKLLVRLYFSGHEKLSEQRWIDRIPSEDPFKGASPKVIRESEASFAETVRQFDSLE
jgi:hypothetical protein